MNKGIIIILVVIVIGAVAFYFYKKNVSDGKPVKSTNPVAPATPAVVGNPIIDSGSLSAGASTKQAIA